MEQERGPAMTHDPRLERLDPCRLKVRNPQGIDATLFAREDVPVEGAAVAELLAMLQLRETVERVAQAAGGFDEPPAIERVAVTPDFHKAAGIPVGTVMKTRGFVVPQAIGNDVNCGMRLHLTDLDADDVPARLDELESACRRLYFEAGRSIPMTRRQRMGLLTNGLMGLLEETPADFREGLWPLFHEAGVEKQLSRIDRNGSLPAKHVWGLDDSFLGGDEPSRDAQIGSIGGGNHFVEIQRVEKVLDGAVAHAWGLKRGKVVVMVHTGSVGVGHVCGGWVREALKAAYPSALKHPENGIFVLSSGRGAATERFWDALHNAANFAFANRMWLALMAWAALREVFGEVSSELLYDAPHNLVWEEDGAFVHRKGACPARDALALAETPFRYEGEPVLVPGSMGASSFVLVGGGNAEALSSASHGAGRALSRGEAAKGHDEEFDAFMKRFRVVTPVDFRRADLRMRRDILDKKLAEIKQEAPHAYKGIGPIVRTLEGAGMARPVAELSPLMTVKG
ncbi:MAG: RtcB family protein [Gemmataceae bacterium]|nr:RtcB family protein [Gemmataceae bacterium]